ncbi:MAG: hypothetical protein ACWGNV_00960 [Bacteroidales bacterium]
MIRLTRIRQSLACHCFGWGVAACLVVMTVQCTSPVKEPVRERISLNEHWRFLKYDSLGLAGSLIYDIRPGITDIRDYWVADEKPTEAVEAEQAAFTLKAWIMPSGNRFIGDPDMRYQRPSGDPGYDFPFVQPDFDDSRWERIRLPIHRLWKAFQMLSGSVWPAVHHRHKW